MSRALLDDHLLRDLLACELSEDLDDLLADHDPATTNLYLYRLAKSVVSAPGGSLTGSWPLDRRRELGAQLLSLPNGVEVVPIRLLAHRIAEIADVQRVSALGAEAVAAATHLDAPLCVWEGDDGPGIRAAMGAHDAIYRTIRR